MNNTTEYTMSGNIPPQTEKPDVTYQLRLQSERCKRFLFRQSSCRNCIDICPSNAIELTLGPQVNNSCIDCGLCQAACPTDVFELPFNDENRLLQCIDEEASHYIQDGQFYSHCKEAQPGHRRSFAIDCIGNLTENALLALTAAGTSKLKLNTGDCQTCKLTCGLSLFNEANKRYLQLMDMLSKSVIKVSRHIQESVVEERSDQSAAVDRRSFFRKLGKGVKQQAAQLVVKKDEQLRSLLKVHRQAPSRQPSAHSMTLRELLREQAPNSAERPAAVDFPWQRMLVDVAHCVGCAICVNVCPNGALNKHIEGLVLIRTLNHSRCNSCGLCAEACPQDVIRFDGAYRLADLTEDKEEVVARVSLTSCVICGETIPMSEGEICTTCQKRQVVPLFM